MSSRPVLVSVGLPVYNGEPFLERALDSLAKQTLGDFEVIICDNASADRTPEICAAYVKRDARFKYYRNPRNIGGPRNHNLTFWFAAGRYFKWAAADDVCLPQFLERCIEVLESNPDIVACYSKVRDIDAAGNILRERPPDRFGTEIHPAGRLRSFFRSVMLMESVLGVMRADGMRQTGLMRLYPGSDVTFMAELLLRGRVYQIPEVLFLRRDYERNTRRLSPEEKLRWVEPTGTPASARFEDSRMLVDILAAIWRSRDLSRGRRVACTFSLVYWPLRRQRARLGRWSPSGPDRGS